jgi:hypothetical protein
MVADHRKNVVCNIGPDLDVLFSSVQKPLFAETKESIIQLTDYGHRLGFIFTRVSHKLLQQSLCHGDNEA